MVVWTQLEVDKAHVAYAILGVSTTIFATCSLFLKEKLFIGEATTSTIVGIITGPNVLNWFNPLTWGNSDYITQEVSRIVLIIQIFAVSVELPKKYMKTHFTSVMITLFFGMIAGWLTTALFVWILFTRINFAGALLISGCVTATDPVLAASIVGKGKFGQRVPGHLRNLLSAESGANDGMAFPFVLLASNLVLNYGHTGKILKDWICVAILYECALGTLLGVVIGYLGRQMIKFCERKNLIDRESFFVFYILLSLICTGFGSILGVDDLLVSFAAGAAFAWDGWFAKKTEESNLSNIIDLLLNMGYFVYFGSIIPWSDYNNHDLGLNIWRLILLGIAIIFLRRIPVFMLIKPFTPDLRTWKEAFFCGHFGPIGVGGVFCSMIATAALEKGKVENYPTGDIPSNTPNEYLIRVLWPIVTFLVFTSILIHGSSVSLITLSSSVKQIKFISRVSTRSRKSSISSLFLSEESTKDARSTRSLQNLKLRAPPKAHARDTSALPVIRLIVDKDGNLKKPETAYSEGNKTIIEDHDGDIIDEFERFDINIDEKSLSKQKLKKLGKELLSMYQVNNEIVIENDDGEVIRKYTISDDFHLGQEENDIEQNQVSNDLVLNSAGGNNQYDEQQIRETLDKIIADRSIRFTD